MEPGVSKRWFNPQWNPSPKMGILKHLSGLTLVHYRELVCLEEMIVDSGFAVAHYTIHLLSIIILDNGLGFVQ